MSEPSGNGVRVLVLVAALFIFLGAVWAVLAAHGIPPPPPWVHR